jgi:hypothetical protein
VPAAPSQHEFTVSTRNFLLPSLQSLLMVAEGDIWTRTARLCNREYLNQYGVPTQQYGSEGFSIKRGAKYLLPVPHRLLFRYQNTQKYHNAKTASQ